MFYKLEGDVLQYGPFITGPGWNLIPEEKDSYTYPIEGWYWFDSEDAARAFFNV